MIAYVRGLLDGSVDADEVAGRTTAGAIVARIDAPPGHVGLGEEVVVATATLPIGVVDHERAAFLGPWPPDAPDPGGPLGLASTPVVLLPDASYTPDALAGVHRAGRGPAVARLEGSTPAL